jgi:chemotaxis signal transduction protein
MDEMQLPEGTIVIAVSTVEEGHKLLETFRNGGAQSAVLGVTEDGEIVIAIEPAEFFSLQGLTNGEMTIEITQDGVSTAVKRGSA